jgi:flagellar biosynthesis protein FlhF
LGAEAIILSTRQVQGGRGPFGLFGRPMLEVTAARDADGEAGEAPGFLASLPQAFAKGRQPGAKGNAAGGAGGLEEQALRALLTRQRLETQNLLAPLQDEIHELKQTLRAAGDAQRSAARDEDSLARIHADLREMRQTIHRLSSQSAGLRDADWPENLVVLYQQLIFGGLEEKFARRLMEEAAKTVPAREIEDFAYVKIFMARMLMRIVKVTGGFQPEPGQRKVCALVGPTGVGKTTTVAKIASEQLLQHRRQVALITVDTFRIAAVEQLKVYAKIMSLPISVVSSRAELRQALDHYADKELVLVDTGGRSQRDSLQMSELRQLLGDDAGVETYLALSAATKDVDQTEITRRFGEVPLRGVIFTKLDESGTFGSLFNHAIRFKLPIAYLTTGQKVPEDLETASKERLVDLLLNLSAE